MMRQQNAKQLSNTAAWMAIKPTAWL